MEEALSVGAYRKTRKLALSSKCLLAGQGSILSCPLFVEMNGESLLISEYKLNDMG